jgi:hypothetical protein
MNRLHTSPPRIFDSKGHVVIEARPTIAWSSSPFAAKEILSVALSFRLN